MVGVLKSWSTTAASNATADSNINYAEGQTPASINDSARAAMAALKGFANQITGAKTSGGSANAQTFTSDTVAAISTAYAAGMLFCFKAGFTNSTTTPTFNVDGVGAKTIKKGGAQAALAASDIVAGGIYWLAYEASGDCFLLLNPESGPVSAQPLDATLTALAALSWSSGNPLLQFIAADTVSLTLTPSVSSVTASQGAANTTPSGTFTNTTDNASVRGIRIEGDRATPAANDEIYASFYLSDSGGTQKEVAKIGAAAAVVTAGSETSQLNFYTITSGTLAQRAALSSANFRPLSNDTLALGTATASFADLFLASGAVLNFNNGNFTLTHSSGTLEASGTFRARVPLSSETGTPTSASLNKKVALASAPTINSIGTADDFILFDPGTSARVFTRGAGMTMYLNGSDAASATLAANQFGTVHWRSSTVAILSGAFS